MPSRSLSHYSAAVEDLDSYRLPDLMARANARWSKKVTAPIESKKVTRRFRRSDSIDQETLEKIQVLASVAESPDRRRLVGIFNPSKPSPFGLKTPPSAPSNDNSIPAWEIGGRRIKLVFANEALQRTGKPVSSWTLNLSPDCIDRALSHPTGLVDCLKRDLDRALKRRLGYVPLYWFGADVESRARLHLHGGIGVDMHDLDHVRAALLEIGGVWTSAYEADRQLDINPQRCDAGWVTYAIRNHGTVRKIIGDRTFTITGLRLLAKAHYDSCRAASRRAALHLIAE